MHSTYDSGVEILMTKDTKEWDAETFENLWPLIDKLGEFVHNAKLWNIWVLFRDRRDTSQYWTFLFVALAFSIGVIQVLLAIAQVVGSF